jgi:hypothetical protein
MKTGKVLIGSCSSAGRNLKTKKSSAAGKTLATTCKTKKATAKTKPVVKTVVKKADTKPVVKKTTVMVKPKVTKSNNLKIEDLVGKKFYINIGSTEVGSLDPWTKEGIIKNMKKAMWYDLFDQDFYYNYTSPNTKNEYYELFMKTIIEPYTKNINKTLNDWFEFNNPKNDYYYKDAKYLELKNAPAGWMDKWFMKTPMSDKLRNEYKYYLKDRLS